MDSASESSHASPLHSTATVDHALSRHDYIDRLLGPRGERPEEGGMGAKMRAWNDMDMFVEDNLVEVYEKLPSLEKQIWGKLVVMEGHRRTAKAYLRHPVVTIDGSDAEFDGMRVGVARFENSYRADLTYEIFNEMLQGIKVKIDPSGNVWAKRMCYSPVFLKPLYRNRPNDLFIIDQRPVKIFDIRRFKEILIAELHSPNPDRRRLEKCCLICLKFSVDHYDLLRTPCYVVLIHLVAIELISMVLPPEPPSTMSPLAPQPYATSCASSSSANPARPQQFGYRPFKGGGLSPSQHGAQGGIFKRIIRKDNVESDAFGGMHRTDSSFDISGYNSGAQHGHPQEKLYASMTDLRPPTGGRHTAPDDTDGLHGFGPTSSRVMSVEALNQAGRGETKRRPREHRVLPVHIGPQAIAAQLDRMRLGKKWRSQDSGISTPGALSGEA